MKTRAFVELWRSQSREFFSTTSSSRCRIPRRPGTGSSDRVLRWRCWGGYGLRPGASMSRMESLREHIDAVAGQELFQGCDFKLAACSRPMDRDAAASCGFDSLSVRLVEEIVTLGVFPSPSLANAGKHLSPEQFHGMLDQAGNLKQSNAVVLDARNIYETRIGKFCPPPGIAFLDPKIRQYSDLPAWIDEHAEQLRNKSVLMYFFLSRFFHSCVICFCVCCRYCTGGVRCEMASAYIRSKGEEFENVYQLSGGIQRYLEAFPEGGYFHGKNFVFDHRISVPSLQDKTVGCCYSCKSPYDDYTPRLRCSMCRMLVLLCESCKASVPYLCELCAANRHSSEPVESGRDKCSKLRILCLHGFRQNASNLKGRLASLSKKLRRTAEFVFIDAPHELPLLYQLLEDETRREPTAQPHKKFAWLTDPDGPKASTQTWTPVQKSFDPMQYQKQTSGWSESWEYLGQVLADRGPFDGVLGFSQGAAVAAILSSLKDAGLIDIKFVVLCSGFVSPVLEQQVLGGLIDCPSLHIFSGKTGNDRQIACTESERLAGKFRPGSRMVVRHDSGHIVPTRPDYLEQYAEFFKKFL
ncbi:rhodanese-like domain-containing protein 6 isoform X2 [Selaginella moellendorffii]|uniref:rhodanese-like domain-containing protein 6 isoform X2 n=1 Tax=Selaginella moellendorffii TaxID=88036 RepID=UPI000D1C6C78|nr:rhodanese-like domain-containing protein 6 isoform X2 [Selaginella moellendorffii]|eukprot:XP_024545346.1 rhodanese-like domain-containing protein 6 isoform X2 [Selaginella moellendorffii]